MMDTQTASVIEKLNELSPKLVAEELSKMLA